MNGRGVCRNIHMRLFTCGGLSRDERGGLGRVYKYPPACSLSPSFLHPLSKVSTSLFQKDQVQAHVYFYFLSQFFKTATNGDMSVCFLFPPGGYDRN